LRELRLTFRSGGEKEEEGDEEVKRGWFRCQERRGD
jgi:hypothetical protein